MLLRVFKSFAQLFSQKPSTAIGLDDCGVFVCVVPYPQNATAFFQRANMFVRRVRYKMLTQ